MIVLRDAPGAPQLCMLRRHRRSGFAADAWVFPGGVVDAADRALAPARWRGIAPDDLAPYFGRPPDLVVGLHVAAVRETFEEAGLLLATTADGAPVDLGDPDVRRMRTALAARAAGGVEFADWLTRRDLTLTLDALTYLSRWITPLAEPKRYDTCFFLARAPEGQVADHDRVETTDQRWLSAAQALEQHRAGELHLIFPTIRTLEAIAAFDSVGAAVAAAAAQPEIHSVRPHMVKDPGGWRIVHPDDPDYPHEVADADRDTATGTAR